MKIQDILEPDCCPSASVERELQPDRTLEIATRYHSMKSLVVAELNILVDSLGHNINSYLYPDEVALVNCIAKLGLQDENYYPTATVESFARYLQARCELSRALA